MNIVVNDAPRIAEVEVTDDLIIAHLVDGRTISVPLAWSWRLSEATPEQRKHFEIIGSGQGVHWPEIDEDISATGMLYGIPARPPRRRMTRPEPMETVTPDSAMNNLYTAVIKQDGEWWIGWIEEIPGVNCQEASRDELLDSLKLTLQEALEFYRQEAIAAAGGNYQEEHIAV